jgi:Flp pilus assembly protein TadG
MARRRDETGEVTEAVLVVPVLILIIFTVIQFGLWYHASSVVRAAAQEGVRTARVSGGTASTGQATAQSFLQQAAGSLVQNSSVIASRTPDVTDVTVTGNVISVVPYLHLPVSGHATGNTERFRAPA